MKNLDLSKLADKIQETFVEQDKYILEKKITEFSRDGVMLGDWFNFLMCDPSTTPPTFFEVSSPFDSASGKAPQHALVFRDGKCIFQTDYTDYAAMRTGMMDALVFKALGTTKLANKKLLMVGSGKTATWSLRGLAALFPDLTEISYLNTGLKNAEFEALATSLSVVIKHVEDKDISSYDYIMCHSKAKESIFNDPTQVKNGAVLTGFISSTPYGEFADSFYNTSQANIIIDWDPNLARMKFIGRQIDAGVVSRDKMFDFRELLNKSPKLNPGAKYTIFTSMGTPIQNLAVLKLLTE